MTDPLRIAAANCPQHTGATQKIRDALALSDEPLSVYKLFLATGISTEKVKSALGQMINRTGSVVSLPGPKGKVYTLFGKAPSAKPAARTGSGQIAGRITIPQFRWGGTRLTW